MAEARPHMKSNQDGPVVIIADSRGYGLQHDLEELGRTEHKNLNIQVFVWKGRGIVEATKQTSKQLIWMAPRLILIFAGICDVTELDRDTWTIRMADENSEETVSRFDGQMDIIRHHLRIFLTEKAWDLAFCELIGADMSKHNNLDYPHPQQEQMEETIRAINAKITAFNASNSVPTPWTAKEIHHQKKSKTKVSRYGKMGPDGLHFDENLRWKIAKILHKYIVKFCEN